MRQKIPIKTIECAEQELENVGAFGTVQIILTKHDGNLKSRITVEKSIVPEKETSGEIKK